MLDFIVLGLPRSATTWLANWLTTDRTLCLHDPFARSLPETWDAGGKLLGISCTGAYLMPTWLAQFDCPVAIIERDPAECDACLAKLGLPDTAPLREPLANTEGRRFKFADLWNEDTARELWAHLLPGLPFDAARYRLLREMRIEPRDYGMDPAVVQQLIERGWLAAPSQGEGECPGA
jgi:hypothetical protein